MNSKYTGEQIEAKLDRVKAPVHASAAIAVSAWTASAGLYSATVNDENIIDGCLIMAFPAQASHSIAETAGIYIDIAAAEGNFTLIAKRLPMDNITIKYTIIQ
jgi:hypothetical protein